MSGLSCLSCSRSLIGWTERRGLIGLRSLRGLSCLSFSRDEKLDSEKRVDSRAKRLERVELLERLERHVLER